MRLNVRELFSRLNSSYWFLPLLVTLAGVALAMVLLRFDDTIRVSPDASIAFLTPSSPEGARALLSAIIGRCSPPSASPFR